ncbi:hypothetical protein TcasGA2_TC033647 [Tribolium castaneum]|uniref:Uncharacterized protein n=1 Tax=Tribolium castaneum TaxID=7070 RepID=A0A139WFW5_TRICA|nr:hypothetical protein TcasGA2_TC033647 [Tribolium castaneum]
MCPHPRQDQFPHCPISCHLKPTISAPTADNIQAPLFSELQDTRYVVPALAAGLLCLKLTTVTREQQEFIQRHTSVSALFGHVSGAGNRTERRNDKKSHTARTRYMRDLLEQLLLPRGIVMGLLCRRKTAGKLDISFKTRRMRSPEDYFILISLSYTPDENFQTQTRFSSKDCHFPLKNIFTTFSHKNYRKNQEAGSGKPLLWKYM